MKDKILIFFKFLILKLEIFRYFNNINKNLLFYFIILTLIINLI